MSTRRTPQWRLVAERELTTRLRDRAYVGGTVFTLVLVIVAIAVSAYLGGRSQSYDVAVVSSPGVSAVQDSQTALRATGKAEDRVDAVRVDDRGAAERALRDGDADAAVLPRGDGLEIVGDEEVDDDLSRALTTGVGNAVLDRNAAQQDVDLSRLQAGTDPRVRLLDPQPADQDGRSAIAFAFALIFLFTALGYGMTIAQSVVQEKESRIVEILAAAVPIRAMLWGKVLGNTLLALLQIVLVVVVGVIGLAVTGRGALLSGVGPAVGWYVALFVLGFVSLAALWSVAGSLASRQEDLQSTTLPGQLLLFVPYFVSIFAGESVKTVFSMLPIVSTMTMPGRIAQGDVPLWQILVAVLTTVAAAAVFIRVGERLYERTLLHTGSKLGYREAMRVGT